MSRRANSKSKSTRNRTRKRYEHRINQRTFRKRLHELYRRVLILGTLVDTGWILVDTGNPGSPRRMISEDQKPESRFFIRRINEPRVILAEGSIDQIYEFINRYWDLRTFA